MRNSPLEKLYKYHRRNYLTDEGFQLAETILKIFNYYPLSHDRIRLSCDQFYFGWEVQIIINLPNIALFVEISNTIAVGIYNNNSPSFQYPPHLQNLTFNQTDIVYNYLTSILDDPINLK